MSYFVETIWLLFPYLIIKKTHRVNNIEYLKKT